MMYNKLKFKNKNYKTSRKKGEKFSQAMIYMTQKERPN